MSSEKLDYVLYGGRGEDEQIALVKNRYGLTRT